MVVHVGGGVATRVAARRRSRVGGRVPVRVRPQRVAAHAGGTRRVDGAQGRGGRASVRRRVRAAGGAYAAGRARPPGADRAVAVAGQSVDGGRGRGGRGARRTGRVPAFVPWWPAGGRGRPVVARRVREVRAGERGGRGESAARAPRRRAGHRGRVRAASPVPERRAGRRADPRATRRPAHRLAAGRGRAAVPGLRADGRHPRVRHTALGAVPEAVAVGRGRRAVRVRVGPRGPVPAVLAAGRRDERRRQESGGRVRAHVDVRGQRAGQVRRVPGPGFGPVLPRARRRGQQPGARRRRRVRGRETRDRRQRGAGRRRAVRPVVRGRRVAAAVAGRGCRRRKNGR